jgi:hypothetical protein
MAARPQRRPPHARDPDGTRGVSFFAAWRSNGDTAGHTTRIAPGHVVDACVLDLHMAAVCRLRQVTGPGYYE